jgi:hypothetical protein
MSPVSRSLRRAVVGFVVSLSCLLSGGLIAAQNPFKKVFGNDKTKYQTFKDPAGRFELEYPAKDWRLLPSGGSSLAVFAHKDGPALFVDDVRLKDRLTPGEIEAMPDVELDRLRKQEPKVKDFQSDMQETKAGRGVLIRYSRAGTEPESVMQYSIPVDLDLYRLNAVVPQRLFSKYEQIVVHMIQSFKAPAGPSPHGD